jgi:hypothetical protein
MFVPVLRIRCSFDPWMRIGDGEKSESGIKIMYHISESLGTLLCVKYNVPVIFCYGYGSGSGFFSTLCPGTGMEKFRFTTLVRTYSEDLTFTVLRIIIIFGSRIRITVKCRIPIRIEVKRQIRIRMKDEFKEL